MVNFQIVLLADVVLVSVGRRNLGGLSEIWEIFKNLFDPEGWDELSSERDSPSAPKFMHELHYIFCAFFLK